MYRARFCLSVCLGPQRVRSAVLLALATLPACAVYQPSLLGASVDEGTGGDDKATGAVSANDAGANDVAGTSGASAAAGANSSASGNVGFGGAEPAMAGAGGMSALTGSGGVTGTFGGAGGSPNGGSPNGGSSNGGSSNGGSSNGGSSNGGSSGGAGRAGGSSQSGACDRTKWMATASSSSLKTNPPQLYNPPVQAIDGAPGTRWSSGIDQAGGEWFKVDLGAVASHLTQVVLDTSNSPTDFPTAYKLELSSDGTVFTPVATGAGAVLTTIKFTDTPARYVRVTQTGVSAAWWSIQELSLVCQP